MSVSSKPLRLAVIGGGIIGGAIGWSLARRGANVTLYDERRPGAASPASGGMLSAVAEGSSATDDLGRDCRLSRGLWPTFAADLESASSETIGLDVSGNILAALSDEEARTLATRAAASGGEVRVADPAIEPALSEQLAALYLAERDGLVDPRQTLRALARALKRSGARRAPTRVERIALSSGRATGVCTEDGTHPADAVVVAAGVWSHAIAVASGLDGVVAPLRPVKGQMLALQAVGRPLRRVVRSARCYLIPRGDRILVGATSEPDRWDTAVTEETIDALRLGAVALLPGLAACEIADAWAGLRPAFASERPLVGACEVPGLFLALGHYRNGILLAPLTAERIAAAIAQTLGG